MLLSYFIAAAGAVVAHGQEIEASALADLSELSDSLGHLFTDEKKNELRAVIGAAAGGWKKDEALMQEIKSLGDTCTVKRLKASEPLSKELFDRASEPLVFRSPEVDKWKAMTRPWTKQFLRNTYGRSHVMPRSPMVLSSVAPDRRDNGGSVGLKMFSFMDSNRSIFDRSAMNASDFEEEDDLLLVDELWDDEEWDVPSFLKNHSEQRGLEIGPAGHGFSFYQLGDMWQALVAGRKLWMLHPPLGLPADWDIAHPRNVFKKALAREGCPQMLHCLLEPGDVLFVPRFWYRATLNAGECVGLGGESDYAMPDEELLAKAAEQREAPERNAMILDMSAAALARKQQWKDALKDSKMAHVTRPSDPFIARRFVELLLAVNKNVSAAQVADKYINRTLTLHREGLLNRQELSSIFDLLAFKMNSNDFSESPAMLTQKALMLLKKAAKLDPNNWHARIMASHTYLLLEEIEMSFQLLADVPADSQGAGPASALLQEMCQGMPEEYKHLQQQFCPEPDEDDEPLPDEAGAEEGTPAEEGAPALPES